MTDKDLRDLRSIADGHCPDCFYALEIPMRDAPFTSVGQDSLNIQGKCHRCGGTFVVNGKWTPTGLKRI